MPKVVKKNRAKEARESRMSSYLRQMRIAAAAEGSQSAANDLER